jgi:hypothetical protein
MSNNVSQKVRHAVWDTVGNPTGLMDDIKKSNLWRFEAGAPTDRSQVGWYYVDTDTGKVYENLTGSYVDTGYTFAGGGGGGIVGATNLSNLGVGVYASEDANILEFKTLLSDRQRVDPTVEKNILIRDDLDEINLTITRGVNQVNSTLPTNIPLFKDVSFDSENIGTLNLKVIQSSDEPDGSQFAKMQIDDTGDFIDFKPFVCVNEIVNAEGGSGGLVKASVPSGDNTNRQTVPIKNIKAGSGLAIVENTDDITLSVNVSSPQSYYFQSKTGGTFSLLTTYQPIQPFDTFFNSPDWSFIQNDGGTTTFTYNGNNGIFYKLTYDVQGSAAVSVGESFYFEFRVSTIGAVAIPRSGSLFAVPTSTDPNNDPVFNSTGTSVIFAPVQGTKYTFEGRTVATSQKNITISEINLTISRA